MRPSPVPRRLVAVTAVVSGVAAVALTVASSSMHATGSGPAPVVVTAEPTAPSSVPGDDAAVVLHPDFLDPGAGTPEEHADRVRAAFEDFYDFAPGWDATAKAAQVQYGDRRSDTFAQLAGAGIVEGISTQVSDVEILTRDRCQVAAGTGDVCASVTHQIFDSSGPRTGILAQHYAVLTDRTWLVTDQSFCTVIARLEAPFCPDPDVADPPGP